MARLMRAGCDERASFSADGRGLSLNFCKLSVYAVVYSARGERATLSSTLPYLLSPAYTGFRSFWAVSSDFLKGSCSFARVKGAVFGSDGVVVSNVPMGPVEETRTSSNLGASCSQLIYGFLDVVDARGEICAVLQELHLLAEVVHGGYFLVRTEAVGAMRREAGVWWCSERQIQVGLSLIHI